MRRAGTWACLLLCFGFFGNTANAADNSTAAQWRALIRIDVEAAYNLLEDNHPAALPQVGDRAFIMALAAAHAKALERAAEVTNYEGRIATLAAFANSMGDGHIGSLELFSRRTLTWVGIIAAKRGPEWVVAVDDPKITGTELKGMRIIGCDGGSIVDLAQAVLAFHATKSDAASQVMMAPWLLIDDGNPFLHRPARCVFDEAGRRLDLALHWTGIARDKLFGTMKQPFGEAGFGVRPSGKGYWVSIQELSVRAQPVLDVVKAQESRIRTAPYVVVDLRGDGGGNDNYGRKLTEELYGAEYVNAILGPSALAGGCKEVFRASPQNIAALAKQAEKFRKEGEMSGAEGYTAAVASMQSARAAGHELSGPLTCQVARPAATYKVPSLMHGKVFVLTDLACFSSCINVVRFFRKLGAIQVGEDTGSDTHYLEVRDVVLPSGLSRFSTSVAILPDYPPKIGPYAPKFAYTGDIGDTAALEKWVTGLAASN